MTDSRTRCGFVAVVGAPNAGKSTLINTLVGSKVSIVSKKIQTTRAVHRAIVVEGSTQIIFLDTPGIFEPRRMLDKAMIDAAWKGASDADSVLVIVDATRKPAEDAEKILAGLTGRPSIFLALNKVDLVKREMLLDLAKTMNSGFPFTDTFMISALKNDGVDAVKQRLAQAMPESHWLYPEDQIADLPLRFLASEITREKIFERLHQELPYASTVETEQWEERPDGSIRIDQVIFVEKESQRKIILGKAGQSIREIGKLARLELRELMEKEIHLFLFVKVRSNWASDPERLRAMGLDP